MHGRTEGQGRQGVRRRIRRRGGEPRSQDCEATEAEEDEASNAIKDASLHGAATVFGLAGGLGLVVALFYTCLWAMRVGLLTRFWGSLGMAVGVAALIGSSPFTLLWFIYFGLLLLGELPGGRPPAWEAGRSGPLADPGRESAPSRTASRRTTDGSDELGAGPTRQPAEARSAGVPTAPTDGREAPQAQAHAARLAERVEAGGASACSARAQRACAGCGSRS